MKRKWQVHLLTLGPEEQLDQNGCCAGQVSERERLVELGCPEGNVLPLPPSRKGNVTRASTGERGCRMCGSRVQDFVDV